MEYDSGWLRSAMARFPTFPMSPVDVLDLIETGLLRLPTLVDKLDIVESACVLDSVEN
jgi:hypothetical protein